jgi:hypothetical protein
VRIFDLQIGLAVLSGADMRLVFADDQRVFVPMAKHAAANIAQAYVNALVASGWQYNDSIEAWVLRDRP